MKNIGKIGLLAIIILLINCLTVNAQKTKSAKDLRIDKEINDQINGELINKNLFAEKIKRSKKMLTKKELPSKLDVIDTSGVSQKFRLDYQSKLRATFIGDDGSKIEFNFGEVAVDEIAKSKSFLFARYVEPSGRTIMYYEDKNFIGYFAEDIKGQGKSIAEGNVLCDYPFQYFYKRYFCPVTYKEGYNLEVQIINLLKAVESF